MANKKNRAEFIEERLTSLKSLKSSYGLEARAKVWIDKANTIEENQNGDNDMRTQISATVKRQKDTELMANLPEFEFIPLNEKGRTNRKVIKEIWDFHWLKSNTDKTISSAVKYATTTGTGIVQEGIKHIVKKIKVPYFKQEEMNGEKVEVIDFKEEVKVTTEIVSEVVPFLNFFVNGTDIENSTEAIVVRYFDKDEYISEKEANSIYKNISKLKDSSIDSIIVEEAEGKDISSGIDRDNRLMEIEYFNSAKDEYVVMANGVIILDSAIPYTHKELPFAIYYDNEAIDRFWGIGEFELLEKDEIAKNEYRTLLTKGVKASIGTTIIRAGMDLDTTDIEYGIGEILESDDPTEIQHFAPNVPIQAISELEARIDNDIIAKSGVDFKSLHLTPGESATKTANKQASTRKRINLNLKDNGFGFFRRLGMLRLSNIQLLHSMESLEIPFKGGTLNANGVFVSDEDSSYGYGIVGKELTEGDYLVCPVTESMTGNSSARKKEEFAVFSQMFGNVMGEDGKPVIKGKQLVKLGAEIHGYDYEKLTEQTNEALSPDDIVNKVFDEDQSPVGPENPNDPNYVPPAQRSQKDQVKTISGQAKIDYNLEE